MSRIFIDGFEAGNLDLWGGSGFVINTPNAITGKYCADGGGGSNRLIYDVGSLAEIYWKFRWKLNAVPGYLGCFHIWAGAANQMETRAEGTNLTLYNNPTTGHQYRDCGFAYGGTYLMEGYFKPSATSGYLIIKVDGVTKYNLTGNTRGSANDYFTQIGLGYGIYAYTNAPNSYFDDFVIDSSNWIGPTRIEAIRPTANGATNQWTASTGSNQYQCVDEETPDDGDWNETNTVDQIDLYDTPTAPSSADVIRCVQIVARVKREGTPTPTATETVLRVNGTNYVAGSVQPGTNYDSVAGLWETNPDTASAWVASDIASLHIGIKSLT